MSGADEAQGDPCSGDPDPYLVGGGQTDLDQVEGVDPGVAHGNAACSGDGVAQRCRPEVLDERDRSGASGLDRVGDVPHLRLLEDMAVGAGLGTGDGSGPHPRLASQAEPEQRPDGCAEVFGLLDRQVAPLDGFEVAVEVLLDGEGVDEADDVALAQTSQLLDHLTAEVRLGEADHEQLYGSDGHVWLLAWRLA